MIDKTLTGVPFFDERYGGTHRHRPMVVCGRTGTGKTVFALQFIMQGLRLDERCLILSAWRANDLIIFAESLGFSLAPAIAAGRLIVLEYSHYVPGRDKEWNIVLPPEGFLELEEVIRAQSVQRVVLDTVLPWVCIKEQERLDEHLFSLVRALDRMQVTAVLTLPKPVSTSAFKVRSTLETLVPVSISLVRETADALPQWIVGKYLGENRLAGGTTFKIIPNGGIQAAEQDLPAPAPPAPVPPAPALPAIAPPALAPPTPAAAAQAPVPVAAPVPPPPAATPIAPEPALVAPPPPVWTVPVFSAPVRPPPPASAPAPVPPPRPPPYEKGKPIRFSSLMPGLDTVKPIPERRNINRPF